jgi:hypothetical protein
MRNVIRMLGYGRIALLVLVALLTVALGAEAQAANRGKVVRYWDRQLHTGGTIQLLDYRVLRCGPRACLVRWHIRAFTPGDEATSPASTSTSARMPATPPCGSRATLASKP